MNNKKAAKIKLMANKIKIKMANMPTPEKPLPTIKMPAEKVDDTPPLIQLKLNSELPAVEPSTVKSNNKTK